MELKETHTSPPITDVRWDDAGTEGCCQEPCLPTSATPSPCTAYSSVIHPVLAYYSLFLLTKLHYKELNYI